MTSLVAPRPITSVANHMEGTLSYIRRVQNYFNQLGYHQEGNLFPINLRWTIRHLMCSSQHIINKGQPIKCLHALVLGVYFTNRLPLVERFPIHFKSIVNENGNIYKHVVLGLYVKGHFGALGISRDAGLQDKPCIFQRLYDLIKDYLKCYEESGHTVTEVKIGDVITHYPLSLEHITWKLGRINCLTPPPHVECECEKIAKKLRSQMNFTCLRGGLVKVKNGNPYTSLTQLPSLTNTSLTHRPQSQSISNTDYGISTALVKARLSASSSNIAVQQKSCKKEVTTKKKGKLTVVRKAKERKFL